MIMHLTQTNRGWSSDVDSEQKGAMSKVIQIAGNVETQTIRSIPNFLQQEETAAQIVALMQARFDRLGPEELQEILNVCCTADHCAALTCSPL